jgi:hypothetical protein
MEYFHHLQIVHMRYQSKRFLVSTTNLRIIRAALKLNRIHLKNMVKCKINIDTDYTDYTD